MLQAVTGLRGALVYRECMAVLARKHIVICYGQVCPGIAWAFNVTGWIRLERDSHV